MHNLGMLRYLAYGAAMRRLLFLPFALLLTGMAFTPPHKNLASPYPVFRLEHFFLGRVESSGTIDELFSRPATIRSHGLGRIDSDGTLILEQIVHRERQQSERRLWRLKRAGEGRFSGTISDAKGPVVAEVSGNCLRIRYTIARGNLAAQSYIYLQPGGRTAISRTIVRKLGLTVARVEESIRRSAGTS